MYNTAFLSAYVDILQSKIRDKLVSIGSKSRLCLHYNRLMNNLPLNFVNHLQITSNKECPAPVYSRLRSTAFLSACVDFFKSKIRGKLVFIGSKARLCLHFNCLTNSLPLNFVKHLQITSNTECPAPVYSQRPTLE